MTTTVSDTFSMLSWNQVLDRLASHADTAMGRDSLVQTRPNPDIVWLSEEQAAVAELLVWCEAGLPGAAGAQPLTEILERMEKGGILQAVDFMAMRRTLEVHRVLGELAEGERFPLVSEQIHAFSVPRTLMDAIDRTLDADGLVRDSASPALSDIRRRVRQLQREIDDVFERIMKSGSWAKYLQDGLVTMRFGRRVVPVKNEFRHNVEGIVHDQSGSGQTVFVEPLAVVERQNRLTTLRQDEAREIERIFAALTADAQKHQDALAGIHRRIEWFDNHMARARYGLATRASLPHLGGDRLNLVEARHPLIENPVPMSLELSQGRPAVVVTGPNTGGKTVSLKTAGLIVLMAMSGLMVPAGPETSIPLYRLVMADIGDEQSLEQSLSTFSSHLVRLAPMMTEAGSDTLCLIDEIGAGTDPEEGQALAEAMVRHLVERRASLICSTHYGRLKLMALKDPRVQNALVEFDRETLSPTYRLVMGSPGSSHAFYIARRMGFPAHLVDQAESLVDSEALNLSEAIQEINRLQAELHQERESLRVQEAALDRQARDLGGREARLEERLEQDREKTLKAWRRELDDMRDKFNQALDAVRREEGRERARAVEALRQQYRALPDAPKGMAPKKVAGTPPENVGDRVRVAGFPDIGTVTDIEGRTATVEVGPLRMKLALSELERVDDAPRTVSSGPKRRSARQSLGEEKSRSLGLEVDLRGMTQDEALEVLDKYLDDAVLAGAPFVRIIHGKGTGVLRRAVTQQLKHDPRVVRHRLGEAGEGGDGVTVAAFEEID